MLGFERTPPEVQKILGRRINQLGLKLEGSPVERYARKLQKELLRKKIRRFQPIFYLTDEWGCPDQEPIIGIPFYLADPALAILEKQMDGVEDAQEIMMYLRHEAGHAFNYAYRLFATSEWRKLFGPFNRRYREHYRPVPFSRRFVRHIEGWYAQKHPDEDFAETFAVWLTPGANWRKRYRGWPVMEKLKYVDRIAHDFGDKPPVVGHGKIDVSVEEMKVTVEQFYRRKAKKGQAAVDLAIEGDLIDIFPRAGRRRDGVRPAAELIRAHRETLVDKITYWTGVRRPIVRALIESMIQYSKKLRLVGEIDNEAYYLVELTVYGTTLAMNYLARGRFV